MEEDKYKEATALKNKLANYKARRKRLIEQEKELSKERAVIVNLIIDPPLGPSTKRSYKTKFLLKMFDVMVDVLDLEIEDIETKFKEL